MNSHSRSVVGREESAGCGGGNNLIWFCLDVPIMLRISIHLTEDTSVLDVKADLDEEREEKKGVEGQHDLKLIIIIISLDGIGDN